MNTPSDPTPPRNVERRARSRFDSMKVWEEASGALLANREVLLAVMGVFVILPSFALAQFWPLPMPDKAQSSEQLLEGWGTFFSANWPLYVAAMLVGMFGMLAALVMLGDPARPTVSQALQQALRGLPAFLVALMAAHAISLLAGFIPATFIAMLGSSALTLLAATGAFVLILYVMVRFVFIGPIVMLDGQRNPAQALQLSFRATKGIGWQLLVFMLLIYFAFFVVGWLVEGGFALVASLIAGSEGSRLAAGLVGSAVQGALDATFVAVIAASYRQLGAPAR